MQALRARKEETDVAAPAMAPPPQPAPAATPAMARKKEAVEVTASAPPASQIAGAAPESVPLDARALFYANQLAQGANTSVKLAKDYKPVNVGDVCLVVRKGDAQMLARVNKGIAAIKADGTLAKIVKKWNL